ncbi:hypothetical protein GW17_00061510 [Ensete ventricosum]|nr:hypothetical protein GW17_00061510 [Ensete ventricosum]
MNLKERGYCVVNCGEDLMAIDFGGDVSLAKKEQMILLEPSSIVRLDQTIMPPQDQAPMKDTDLELMSMNLKEGDRCVVNRNESMTTVDFSGDVSLVEKLVRHEAGAAKLVEHKLLQHETSAAEEVSTDAATERGCKRRGLNRQGRTTGSRTRLGRTVRAPHRRRRVATVPTGEYRCRDRGWTAARARSRVGPRWPEGAATGQMGAAVAAGCGDQMQERQPVDLAKVEHFGVMHEGGAWRFPQNQRR